MRTGVVDGVEGSIDVKQRNPDSLDFDSSSGSWRNLFYCCDVDKLRHGADSFSWPSGRRNWYIPQTGNGLISTEAYGIEKVRVQILHPGPLAQGASVGNEVVAWK
jgi:hypothetical protein